MMLARVTLGPKGRNVVLKGLSRSAREGRNPRTGMKGFGLYPFDSWWWGNRKLIVVGGGALVGAGLLAIVAKVLK